MESIANWKTAVIKSSGTPKSDGKRFPIRKVDLETLHRFDEEVRYILGLKSLYNESLGTTNARTVYDRLTGRPDR